MANTASLISYPRFEHLENSNIIFMESVSHQKKFRKSSHYDKKDLPSLKENYSLASCNPEITTTNTSRVRKKDVEILPILVENEEKEENLKTLGEIVKVTAFIDQSSITD